MRTCAGLVLAALLPVASACGGGELVGQRGDELGMVSEKENNAPVVYVALGDSTGVGVGARKGGGYVARLFERIERVRPGSRLFNLCVSGATTADVIQRQTPQVETKRPTLITLGIGINDVTHNVTLEQFTRNYEEIIVRLKKNPDARIVITNIPDVSYAPRVPVFLREVVHNQVVLFNGRIAEIAARHNLLMADAYKESSQVIQTHPEFFSPDGFHPSDEGYEFWAVKVWPVVKQAIGQA